MITKWRNYHEGYVDCVILVPRVKDVGMGLLSELNKEIDKWKGPWRNNEIYAEKDVVLMRGKVYVCIHYHLSTGNGLIDRLLFWRKLKIKEVTINEG